MKRNSMKCNALKCGQRFGGRPLLLIVMIVWVCATSLSTNRLWAHDGEEHVHAESEVNAITLPSGGETVFETASDQVELVGRFEQGMLQLYLDDFATNSPLTGLTVEISADQHSVKAVERNPGEYQARLEWVTQPGHYPLVFLIEGEVRESEAITDLLQATLDIAPSTVAASSPERLSQPWLWGVVGVAGVVVLGLIGWRLAGRHRVAKLSCLLFVFTVLADVSTMPDAWAHGGEEHSHDETPPPVVAGNAPRRLPDGRVFIPKATQRLLVLRTFLTTTESSFRNVALNGRVIADPAASGVVQAGQAGRIEAGPQGFPVLGQKVAAGQVLALLSPLTTTLERGNQQALLADMNSQLDLSERKRTRLESLEGSVPHKDIEAARLEADSLRKRRDAVSRSLYQKEPLTAPVAGVISDSNATVGQVVSEGTLLFTVVQPDRLWVEALAYDPLLILSDDKAVAQAGSLTATLTRVGSGAALRDQSIPLHFRIDAPAPALPIGQPVTVLVKTQTPVAGVPVPVDALARNAEGQWVVWLHEKAEIFKPVVVQSEALDGERVMITQGIAAGVRVVSAGAASLAQIR